MPPPVPAPDKPDAVLATELWSDLGRVVKDQLVSDVPVGVFLSGGIDSSLVATAAVAAGGRMKAFSIGFDDATFDESKYARMVAERLDVEWISETLHERNLLDVMDAALDHIDEPLADPSFLPTFLLSRLAARHVKVVVGGDGGDELWGGYPTYRAHGLASVYQRVPGCIRKQIVNRTVGLDADQRSLPEPGVEAAPVHQALGRRHGRRATCAGCRASTCPIWPGRSRRRRGCSPATLATPLPETEDSLQRILALDFATYMPGSVLTKVDRASMAHGLEVRPPLLDDAMLERAFALPSATRCGANQASTCSSSAARGKNPDEIIDRPKKGFGIPLASVAARSAQGPDSRGRRAARPSSTAASSTATSSAAGTTSTRRSAPTTASRCGRCSCWTTGSDATDLIDHPMAPSTRGATRMSRSPRPKLPSFPWFCERHTGCIVRAARETFDDTLGLVVTTLSACRGESLGTSGAAGTVGTGEGATGGTVTVGIAGAVGTGGGAVGGTGGTGGTPPRAAGAATPTSSSSWSWARTGCPSPGA